VLNELGFSDIEEAEDGAAALSKIKTTKYDLLVTDWNMPNMSGLDLVKAVRQSMKNATLPALMVTAEAKKEQIIEAAKAGANGYILKPFTADTMKEKLEKIFNK